MQLSGGMRASPTTRKRDASSARASPLARARPRLSSRNYWIDAGDGVIASLSVFDDKEKEGVGPTRARLSAGERRRAHPEPSSGDRRLRGRERHEV